VLTITVVLTTHDRVALADRALASIRAQTHPVDRVIVVDDAGAEPYRPQGDDVTIVRLPVNVGVCAARNHALALADTDVVTFVDDDDWLDPTFVADHLRGLARSTLPAPVASLGTRVFVEPDGTRHEAAARPRRRGESWMADPASTTENTLVVPVAVLREIGGFDPALSSWEHVDLMQRLLRVCSIEHVPAAGYCSPVDDGIARLSTSWRRVADAIEGTMAKHPDDIASDRRLRARYLRAAAANRVMARDRRRGLWLAGRAVWVLPDRRSARTLALAIAGPRPFRALQRGRRWWRGPRPSATGEKRQMTGYDVLADASPGSDPRRSSRHVSML
jgi:glycosyltransferase involved in cell wall biosynthesis